MRIQPLLCAALALVWVGPSLAAYNAVSDFSYTNNPAGPWSYGQAGIPGGPVTLLSPIGYAGDRMRGWGTNALFPFVVANITDGPVQDGTTTYAPGWLALHPSFEGVLSVVRWTAPVGGAYSVDAKWGDVQNEDPPTVDLHVHVNGVSIYTGSVPGTAQVATFATRLALRAGDTVDFMVGSGGNLFYYDHTAFDATITHLAAAGDANEDGRVDGDDYALVDRGLALQLGGWTNGDFDGSGVVDVQDYLILDQAFGAQSGGLAAGLLPERLNRFGEKYVGRLLDAVPEPAGLGGAAFGLVSAMRRCRRRPR